MARKAAYDHLLKLLIIGDSGVGKSCLLLRFGDDSFITSFITTRGVNYKIKTIDIRGQRVKFQILDTAGQERFRTISTAYYRGAMGIILVYDITDEHSFLNVRQSWMRNIEQHAPDSVINILIANKCDMHEDREVTTERGQAFANEYGMKFYEASAKTGTNVSKAFRAIATDILRKRGGVIDVAPEHMNIHRHTSNDSILSEMKFTAFQSDEFVDMFDVTKCIYSFRGLQGRKKILKLRFIKAIAMLTFFPITLVFQYVSFFIIPSAGTTLDNDTIAQTIQNYPAFQVYHPKIAPFKTQTIRHHNLKICYLNIDGNAKKKKAPERNNTIPGYEPYHFSAAQENNNKRSIGGIMIFTRLELKAPMIITKDYNDCDLVWMRLNNTMYAIGYCRPGDKQYNINRIDSFFNHLDEDIQEYKDKNNVKNIVLIGDFNARCGNQTGDKKLNSNGKDLIALLQKHELKILNNKYNYGTPTFTTSKNGTSCIDFGLTNKDNDDITLQIDTHPLFYAHRPLIITQKIDADLVTIEKK
eukprot:734125_1